MIRVFKSDNTPTSLTTTKAYDGQDVQRQLREDQHSKCYLCESKVVANDQIEHFKSQKNSDNEAVHDWHNLLLSCNHCNGKKLHYFDNLLNPLFVNIEDEIKQEIDLDNKKAIFSIVGEHTTEQHLQTIKLLTLIYNGNGRIRKIREESFFEYAYGIYSRFIQNIADYMINPSEETKKIIIDELAINKELLGLKYWVIQNKPVLKAEFAPHIIWNKQ